MEEKVSDLSKDYKTICTAVPEFSQFSLQEFSTVRMLISSRIFGITVKGVKTDALVPLADMLNHKRPQQTAWEFSDKRDGFIIETKENIERGDQVYDSYGKKCNSRFLLNYGFYNENNDANEVPLVVRLDPDDILYDAKLKIVGYNESKKIRVSEDLTEKNMHHFFSLLRFSEFTGDPMKLYNYQFQQSAAKKSDEDDDENSYQGTNIPPISIDNEKRVLKRISDLSIDQLKKYPTTYEEDLKILETKSKEMTFNQRNCVLMRSGEKKVKIK